MVRNLKAIKQNAENVSERNHEIKTSMDKALPVVILIWILAAFVSILSLPNLKAPVDQEYIFRNSAAEMQGVDKPGSH